MALFFTENLFFRTKKFLHDTFFTQFVLSNASDNTTSRNIGGTDAWAVNPTSHFWGTVPPVPPMSPPMGDGRPHARIRIHNFVRYVCVMVPLARDRYIEQGRWFSWPADRSGRRHRPID